MIFGRLALVELGVDEDEAGIISREIRGRDAECFELEIATGEARACAELMYGNIAPTTPRPTPFTRPRRGSRMLNPDAVPHAEQAEMATRG
ncbi:transporter [Xanthomonas bromi]|uniref:Transporter n=1 Tax=Xanthomonas bromi TaxID=56449 RepID=A0A1C3NP62_9XANT|nr:transporter [Xanthomonas bromi]